MPQERARKLVQNYQDLQSKRQEEVQAKMAISQNIMSIVLSVFSPLGFLA